jgi:uncharacterized protein YdeI (BOF family)
MVRVFIGLVCVVLLASCGPRQAVVLGRAPRGEARSIASVKTAVDAVPTVLQGVMIEKCPVAGCWFVLRDETGTIKVDTKAAGFVVVDVPLKTRMTVAGSVVTDGADRSIRADGLSY